MTTLLNQFKKSTAGESLKDVLNEMPTWKSSRIVFGGICLLSVLCGVDDIAHKRYKTTLIDLGVGATSAGIYALLSSGKRLAKKLDVGPLSEDLIKK